MGQRGVDIIIDALDDCTHDKVIDEFVCKYEGRGRTVYPNRGKEKNRTWNGYYADIIVPHPNGNVAIVIEVETHSTITDAVAKKQWARYAGVYNKWHLAVPADRVEDVRRLLSQHRIKNCCVVGWERIGLSDKFRVAPLPSAPSLGTLG